MKKFIKIALVVLIFAVIAFGVSSIASAKKGSGHSGSGSSQGSEDDSSEDEGGSGHTGYYGHDNDHDDNDDEGEGEDNDEDNHHEDHDDDDGDEDDNDHHDNDDNEDEDEDNENNDDDTATLYATKIVCEDESDLPNWGNGGPDITSSTAEDFLDDHSDCHLANWTFEWATSGTPNPGDEVADGGNAWTEFTSIATVPAGNLIWVREQFDNDYISFSGDTSSPRDDDFSAELYCSTDVLNYDNYDFVSSVKGGHSYYCVGWNVLKAGNGNPDKECSDNQDNDDDNLVDEEDPGCHTDGDADNDDSYNPDDNDETNTNGGGGGGGSNPECSDDQDNDGDDQIDEEDPGCHTDGDADNDDSYNPNDDDEEDDTDPTPTPTGDTQCSDGIDNDNNGFTDFPDDRKSCNSKDDDNEHNNGGGGGGGGGGGRRGGTGGGQILGTSTTCGIYVDDYLRVGYRNDSDSVKEVQQFLNDYMHSGLAVDGFYGPATAASVSAFQVAHQQNVLSPWGISNPTGIFYLTTQTAVNNIMCPTLNLSIPSPLVNFSQNPNTPPPVLAIEAGAPATNHSTVPSGSTPIYPTNLYPSI